MSVSSLIAEHRVMISLGILVLMLIAFMRERLPPSGVGVIGAAVFILLGYVTESELLAVFSNSAAIAIGGMLVLSAALVRTGTLEALAGQVLELARTRPVLAVVLVLGVALVASAFVNSTPVVVILIPLVGSLAAAVGMGAKKLLIPLSYVAILGGSCTLIGTSTNLLVDSIAQEQGLEGFGIFDITVVGLIAAVAGCGFLALFGRILLPVGSGTGTLADESIDVLTELRLGDDFAELGKPWARASFLSHRGVKLVRASRGSQRIDVDDELMQPKDRVVLRVTSPELATLATLPGIVLGLRVRRPSEEAETIGRITVATESAIVGRRLREAHFMSRFAVSVIGVRRRRNLAGPELASLVVKGGDRLYVRGPAEQLAGIASDPWLIPSTVPPAKPFLRDRALAAVLTLALVIACAALGLVPLAAGVVIGVGFLLAINSIDTADAWSALNADVLVLIYAMLVVGTGLQNTGAVDAVITASLPLLDSMTPLGIIVVVYVLTSVLTETVTNNAVAVIMTPLVIGLAAQLDVPPLPLVVSVMFAASGSFATPIGYQTNTLVHIAGNYRFTEFLKIGIPMKLLVGAVTCVGIDVWF